MGVLDVLHEPLDGLLVGNLRLADVGLDLEFPAHAVHQDVQMQLAHAADDGLAGLGIQVHLEGRILFGELLDRQISFSWSLLVFGSMATSITGSGKVIDSSTICWFGSLKVSPVVVSLRPITA